MDDDASTLIAGLEEKLADLDRKVATYRQDLAHEYTLHSDRVLRDLPAPLSATIRRSVALAAHKYPAISPALPAATATPALTRAESPTSGPSSSTPPRAAAASIATTAASASASTPGTGVTTTAAATAASRPAGHEASCPASRSPRPATPPPSLRPPRRPSRPPASDDLGHMSDSPDDREADLRGVFVPSFLPLLDTSFDRMRSPPTPPKPRAPRDNNPMATTTTTTPMDAGEPGRLPTAEPRLSSSPMPAQLPIRPPTVRRATDDLSTSSVLSDKSDSKSRRSALRRSSSSSKPQSPRRVRFEVAGAEVLPTSSPSDSSPDFRQPPSDVGYTAPTHEGDDESSRPRSVAAILGLGDAEDDEPPPPRKVSSTQALRALSRMPLDSDTVWVPVTQEATPGPNNSGGRGPDAVEPKASLKSGARTGSSRRPGTPPPPRPANLEAGRAKTHLGAPLQPAAASWQDDEDSDDSDEDFLSIARPKPKSFAKKKAPASPRSRSPSSDEASRTVPARRVTTDAVPKSVEGPQVSAPTPGPSRHDATQRTTTQSPAKPTQKGPPDVGPDYSDVFDFEGSDDMPARPPTPPADDYPESDPEEARPVPREPLHMYSTSPAVNIPQPPPGQKPGRGDEAASTPTNIPGSVSKATPAVGSYRGRSITMPVVVNPSVHEQAAAMGEFNSFVGGLDGRSGFDDGDVNSFRASLAPVDLTGTPRSLTERLMMEERLGKGLGWEEE